MPNEFDPDQMDKISKWLHEKVKTVECTWCGENEWEHARWVVSVEEFYSDSGKKPMWGYPDRTYPLVMLICGNCGHSIFFNALKLGVIDRSEIKRDV